MRVESERRAATDGVVHSRGAKIKGALSVMSLYRRVTRRLSLEWCVFHLARKVYVRTHFQNETRAQCLRREFCRQKINCKLMELWRSGEHCIVERFAADDEFINKCMSLVRARLFSRCTAYERALFAFEEIFVICWDSDAGEATWSLWFFTLWNGLLSALCRPQNVLGNDDRP